MKITRSILISLFCCVSANVIYASNYSFLNYSAVFYFQGKDADMMAANINNALSHTPNGKKSSWKNPATGAWGYAIPSHTAKKNATVCRDLKIYNNANHVSGESNYTFCKINNEWKVNSQ